MKYGVLAVAFLSFLPPALGPPWEPAPPQVVVVPLSGELTPAHTALVRRAARSIRASPPAAVVFEIDTPGGRADVMLDLGDAIANLAPVPTVASIRPLSGGGGAWSAGAYVALSCGRLFMSPGTVIGAAAPVSPTGGEISEKHVSAFREKFRARAEQNGYPGSLAAAMVDADLELFEVVVDGRPRFLTAAEIERIRSTGATLERAPVLFKPKGKLLTLTDRQAAAAGMARIAADRSEIYRDLGLAAPAETVIAPSWSERLAGFLTRGAVSTVLLIAGLLGLWLEFKTPGASLPGVLGGIALLLLFFGSHLAGLAEAPEILLFVAGLALIAVELFLLPGVGVAAVVGIVCVLVGLVLSLQSFGWPDSEQAPWEVDLLLSSVGRVLTAIVAAGGLALALLRVLPRVPFLGRLVLRGELAAATVPAAPASRLPEAGSRGYAATTLRPAGKVAVDGELVDAVSEGEYVAKGEPVEVVRVEGSRVVISKLKR